MKKTKEVQKKKQNDLQEIIAKKNVLKKQEMSFIFGGGTIKACCEGREFQPTACDNAS